MMSCFGKHRFHIKKEHRQLQFALKEEKTCHGTLFHGPFLQRIYHHNTFDGDILLSSKI